MLLIVWFYYRKLIFKFVSSLFCLLFTLFFNYRIFLDSIINMRKEIITMSVMELKSVLRVEKNEISNYRLFIALFVKVSFKDIFFARQYN